MSQDTSQPPRVRRLEGALIDQIAAGEVVERPASIVKELVENALDAQARRIRVEVRAGGRDWIAVTDDGLGMSPEDAELALERHATSKVATADDLQRIGSYGFRGEALPAIASVSSFRLRTRPRGASEAFEIRVRGGERLAARAVGGPEGTRVEVADLFEAVPARRKFLKTATTEWGHAADWLTRAALALPEVHFDVHRDDRSALVWPAARSLRDRAAAVLGEKEVDELVDLELVAGADGRARVHGLVSRVDRHRATTAGIRLFVNRRSVRDRMLQHALLDVYRDILPRGRFPTAVLFLEVPPEEVDVNVHPAKWEVRFAEPRAVHGLLRDAVRSAIASRSWVAAPGPGGGGAKPVSPAGWTPRVSEGTTDWIFARGPEAGGGDATHGATMPLPEGGAPAGSPVERVRFADLRLLGQLLSTYLLLEAKDQLLLVDQHAAHERVLYERLRAEWVERGVERQALLTPLTVELEPRSAAALSQDLETALRLGFEVESFGDQTFALRALPALLADRDPVGLLRSLAEELAAGSGDLSGGSAIRALAPADRAFATLACHSARRKGDHLEPTEQRALIDALDAIPWAPTCPHGRPVAVPVELHEIERRFGRR
jgi:DNA mismatch repair protein MutL